MMKLTIEVQDKIKDNKSRAFSAALLGYIAAPVWESGMTDTGNNIRPVYLSVAGTETSLRPFLANLKRGAKALITDGDRYMSRNDRTNIECIRSASYESFWHRMDNSVVVTLYIAEAFAVDPGMIDPARCDFLSMPTKWWCEKQLRLIAPSVVDGVVAHAAALGLMEKESRKRAVYSEHDVVRFTPIAGHFAMMLDRRTRRPLINDLRFSFQIYAAALDQAIAAPSGGSGKWSGSFKCFGADRLGFEPGVVVHVTHDKLDRFLAEQIAIYQETAHVTA